ncbi:MAG: hypothetical protein A3E21_03385 [Sulfurimonas sp. RIFCSPHIGHO2_12_FULL_36_9]|uniref:hypothetical protein n=1 Tax=Sulfurimonas sp. RIFCSPLOWO2_12_36_12 TaxID=1802253 RepID=UPI0008C823A4|nr:hypothetical protein [Sulfurimonas sp. RIFCSPLOWO2_12_36_12]OHD96778.1 MAG: hypothetical protein A3E21_03385 [Sulfurimonas sp. RIFCSPHIGHO2_12_FULL_36_9]OHE02694.1 MAG: hypothetical protein A2W82_02155 [Sulfurimonas sp. RIFCSPLOWO2_12_36_12]OHE04405.1 MAG: hypothetical protein A3K14_05215 [Sulfurimonas sp. RIFCSPLOWO2_12_FULL_36_74]
MKIYYYVHTGHRTGLDRFRRACTIIRALGDVDITLLCSDFRIASEAKHFGISKSVGIDVVRNIPKIANYGDKIIFDSDEANPIMLEDMRKYFSAFIRISDNKNECKADNEFLISPYLSGEGICNAIVVDDKYFQNEEKTIKLSYFFGDDDYEKDLEKNLGFIEDLNPDLLLGFYYFLDYEDFLRKKFKNHHEFEEYDEVIKKSQILITASPQAVLENLASGAKPIYVQRDDHTTDFLELFKTLNIPIVKNYDKAHLIDIISSINNNNYFKMEHSSNKIANFIKENLNL